MIYRNAAIRCLKAVWPEQFLRMLVGRGSYIRTYTSIPERILLYDEATLAFQNGVFAEIGSYLGASAVVLAEAMKRRSSLMATTGKVYCIDTWNNDAMSEGKRSTWEEFSENTKRWKRFVVPLRGESTKVDLPADFEIDLLFIDGDHSYKSVRADVEKHMPAVRIGGRIVFHDQDRPDVAKVVGELLATGKWRITSAVERIVSLARLA